MTRKLRTPTVEHGKSRKRVLKPVVEKKRRDRINLSLAELRSLLLNHTSDARLQNPKIEKAEILDLAVEYLQKWTDPSNGLANSHMKTHTPVVNHSEARASLFTMESAGFQQCVTQLTSYMHKITPSQRSSLIEGLKLQTESQQPNNANTEVAKRLQAASVHAICTSKKEEKSPKFSFPSYSQFQPHSCSTPNPNHLSPPPSPWLSPSWSTYATSPPFPSFPSHLSPPSLSPLSSNTSFFCFPPTFLPSGPPLLLGPPLTMSRTSAQREGLQANSSSPMWRPWF